jgi:hypothetical protein
MSDRHYGYEKPSMGSAAQYDSYTFGQDVDWEHTDFSGDQADIEKFWTWVRGESDEHAFAAAEYWRRVATLLETTATNLRRHTDALLEKWKSPAADDYARRVGAALHSLDEWSEIASSNADGISSLAVVIAQTQQKVKPIWEEFRRVDKEEKEKRDKDDASFRWLADIGDGGKPADEVRKTYTEKAKPHVEALAKMYLDTYIQKVSTGGTYKGPTNAVAAHDPKLNPTAPLPPGTRGGAPARPGTRPGAAPNRPDAPNRPELQDRPAAPDQPNTPLRPDRPEGPDLAGTATAPPAPQTTHVPNPPVTPAPNGPPPATPALPHQGGRNRLGPRPPAPNLNSTAGPGNRPPGSPPPPPGGGKPGGRAGSAPPPLGKQPPGQGSQPARPGPTPPPPLGRNRPSGRPSTNPLPGGQPATPPTSLGGKRGARPAGTDRGRPLARPAALGQPEQPSMPPRPGQQGTAKPPVKPPASLGGRRTPPAAGSTDPDEQHTRRAGLRSGLQGRATSTGDAPHGFGPTAPARGAAGSTFAASGHRQSEGDELVDEEMWSVEEAGAAAPAIIDAPAEKAARQAGPALGSGH